MNSKEIRSVNELSENSSSSRSVSLATSDELKFEQSVTSSKDRKNVSIGEIRELSTSMHDLAIDTSAAKVAQADKMHDLKSSLKKKPSISDNRLDLLAIKCGFSQGKTKELNR